MALNPPPKQNRCLAVFVRDPEPGKVKTRLAKTVRRPFRSGTLRLFRGRSVRGAGTGKLPSGDLFHTCREGDGDQATVRLRFCYSPQEGEGLGKRMENAFRSCFAKGFAATLLIGSDFPDLTAEVIEQAFMALENGQDAVVGPAFDGGYYLIGFHSDTFDPVVFTECPGEKTASLKKR